MSYKKTNSRAAEWGRALLGAVGALLTGVLAGCTMDPSDDGPTIVVPPTGEEDKLIIVCEGLWGMDNSCLAYIDGGVLTDKWFREMNPGMRLGDTGNDIIQVNDTLIAISVNWSNIIQYIRPDGRAITATEDLPNNRKLATDGERYVYCTSYARHGYVAKIDMITKQIVDSCRTGYEPEGLAYYDGKLFVANTGGYSFQEKDHGYETTVSVIDAETMQELKRIDTGCKNLYGKVSQCGRYLCINSAGDYYNVKPRTVVLNMESEEFRVYDFPATYNCTYNNKFYAIGSAYSYTTGKYEYSVHTISLPSLESSVGLEGYDVVADSLLQAMQSPYGIYISPYTGNMYVSDARSYATNGIVYEIPRGEGVKRKHNLRGVNPAHFLALPR